MKILFYCIQCKRKRFASFLPLPRWICRCWDVLAAAVAAGATTTPPLSFMVLPVLPGATHRAFVPSTQFFSLKEDWRALCIPYAAYIQCILGASVCSGYSYIEKVNTKREQWMAGPYHDLRNRILNQKLYLGLCFVFAYVKGKIDVYF